MKQRTFEEIVKSETLSDGTKVKVRIGEKWFDGKIVGRSGTGIIPWYIVECLDGTFPNEIYDYKFLSLPLTEIFLVSDLSESHRPDLQPNGKIVRCIEDKGNGYLVVTSDEEKEPNTWLINKSK